MSMYLTREPESFPAGFGPRLPFGLVHQGVHEVPQLGRMYQPGRLEVSHTPVLADDPATWPKRRLMNPHSIDAGRLLDYGAPAPRRFMVTAPFPYRPTEQPVAPGLPQRGIALGGRFVGF